MSDFALKVLLDMERQRHIAQLLGSGWERVRVMRNGRLKWHWRLKRRPAQYVPSWGADGPLTLVGSPRRFTAGDRATDQDRQP